MNAEQRKHRQECAYCRGEAELKPLDVIPGRPRDSRSSLRLQPLYFKSKTPKGKKAS